MPIRLDNVGIAVRDLEATIAFFTDLGLTVLGRDTVSGEWTDTAVGLDGNHANIAMLQTPDGNGRLELFEYIHPDAIETKPTRPNEIGMHRVAFSVDDIDEALEIAARHGCHPLRGVPTYEDVYKVTYIRGPSGIIGMLAEALNESRRSGIPLRDCRNVIRSARSELEARQPAGFDPQHHGRSAGLDPVHVPRRWALRWRIEGCGDPGSAGIALDWPSAVCPAFGRPCHVRRVHDTGRVAVDNHVRVTHRHRDGAARISLDVVMLLRAGTGLEPERAVEPERTHSSHMRA